MLHNLVWFQELVENTQVLGFLVPLVSLVTVLCTASHHFKLLLMESKLLLQNILFINMSPLLVNSTTVKENKVNHILTLQFSNIE